MKPDEKQAKAVDAPMAVASDGRPLFNVLHLVNTADVQAALREVMDEGHQVFVAIAVPAYFEDEVRRDLDDAAAGIVGRLGVRIRRRARRP